MAKKKAKSAKKKDELKRKRGRPALTEAQKADKRKRYNEQRAARRAAQRSVRDAAVPEPAKSRASKKRRQGEAKRSGPGRPPFEPTKEDRARVQTLAGLGMRHDEICLLVDNPETGQPISEDTLRKYFKRELERGAPMANSTVARALYTNATSASSRGHTTASIFWAKTRMGWKETVGVEVEAKSGVLLVPGAMTPGEWIERAANRTGEALDPGERDD
jgi:hypothetical protein